MKVKHNKKRNTAFLFESLVRELTKSIVSKKVSKSRKIKEIFHNYFSSGTVLAEELACYRTLCEKDNLDQYTAEKIIFHTKKAYEELDKNKIFEEQSKVIKEINTTIGTNVYKNFVPNYRAYATVAQIFADKTPVKSRILLEKQILETITEGSEESEKLAPVDSLVVKSFTERFNNTYKELLPEQQELLTKYIVSFGINEADFKVAVGSELKRIKEEVESSLKLEEVSSDEDMVNNTHKVLEQIKEFNIGNISNDDLLKILKLQHLVNEYQTDAN